MSIAAGVAVGGAGDELKGLRPAHPRLLAVAADWRIIAERRAREPDFAELAGWIIRHARAAADLPPVERVQTGRRLLAVSRETLRRVLHHAAAFRMTGDRVFVEAARREMLAASAFSDWNPSHFLDVGEMSAALGIGYDWLFDELDNGTRATIRAAIVRHGLQPALARTPAKFFYTARHNWNQVCLGGLALGALAIAEDEPALAGEMIAAVRAHIGNGLSAYAPDGVYPEGPMYWYYGTSYQVALIEAMRTALGTDGDMSRAAGFLASAEFMLHLQGPTGQWFNYADAGQGSKCDPTPLWFARELRRPALCAATLAALRASAQNDGAALRSERLMPLALVWWPSPEIAATALEPLHWHGRGPNPVAVWRTAWNEPDAVFFAIKAGGAGVNHGHMDAGSFVLDAGGVRWALDLGRQDYESLERHGLSIFGRTQDATRWTIFRMNNHAHNTLTIGEALHRVDGLAKLTRADPAGAELDLSPVFAGQAERVTRSVRWRGAQGVELEDRIEGAPPGADIRWAMITDADPGAEGLDVVLRRNDRALAIRFEAAAARIEIVSVEETGGYNASNPGCRRIELHTRADVAGRALIRAALIPDGAERWLR